MSTLHVSTSGTDADWVVKVIDVYPGLRAGTPARDPPSVRMGGYQQLVRGEPFRGKFRNSFETAGAVRAQPADGDRASTCPTSRTRSAAATG